MTANAYSFLPWLRTGLTTRITTDPGTAPRATIPVRLRLTGDALGGGTISQDVEQPVQLYGPGDVIGVDSRAVTRTEPRPWITNVEPNYLAHIEFYDEDFPWRYSPAAPDAAAGRLAPWLALVVLAAGSDPQNSQDAEFTEGVLPGRPLPFITVHDPAATLPPPDQVGAWAHVHVNGELAAPIVSDDMAAVLPALAQVLATNADSACSRLICPRHLSPDTTYHAFLVPAFETGRLAGLGFDPALAPAALHRAWGPDYPGRPAAGQLPYYYRWFFGTGSAGDFEFLVRLLQPREPDPRVARRDIDVHRPAGPGLPGITTPAELGGVLRLGGALQIPLRTPDIWDTWDEPHPHPFQVAMAGLVNLADDYTEQPPAAAHANLAPTASALADETDPIVTPPLYGRWPAVTARLLSNRDGTPIPAPQNRNWVHRLNLDPRFRVAANFGTQVVQRRQEEFMVAAWTQIGEVLAANGRIRAAQLAREVGFALHAKHLASGHAGAEASAGSTAQPSASSPARALTLTAPASSRVTATTGGPGASAGVAGRARGLVEFAESVAVGFQVATSQVAAAPVSAAMRRITRPGSRLMRSLPFTPEQPADLLLSLMDAEVDAVTAAAPKQTPAAVVTPEQLDAVLHPVIPLAAAGTDPVDGLPTSADFVISVPEDEFVATPGGPDSPDAVRFKEALRDLFRGRNDAEVGGRVEPRGRLDVDGAAGAMLAGLRADLTVPKHLLSAVRLPPRLRPFAERFIEAMAYPVIDIPMYQPLLDMSVDAFVPNLNLIPPNTITLLETDQEFIEAYLVGLNHEMARELLWREYPTDQRGSVFRQFWDPRPAPPRPGETPQQQRERLYDIEPIHGWSPSSKLGEHDNRESGPTQENELVLVIRGELLKKYPTAAIYAHRAAFTADPTAERELADVPEGEHPPLDLVRLPRYEAKVEPDIYLLGFDLTAAQALGNPPHDPGWFFVIKERPGDPRFGADETRAARVEVWNDLSWPDLDPDGSGFIRLDPAAQVPLAAFDGSDDDPEKQEQRVEDAALPLWYAQLSSADIAYILFQAPVLMAVHAQEMLPDA